MAELFDDRRCDLGEGPLWHSGRGSLLWFDINGFRLLERQGDAQRYWQFEGPVSAAGIINQSDILVASHLGLARFNLDTGATQPVAELEADKPTTRSNDGRADPWGGFWVGTMGRQAQAGEGAIYRYADGSLRCLHDRITISNSICFAPDRSCAYFSDTPSRTILKQPLDESGWPAAAAEVFVHLGDAPGNPDGAVCDAEGYVWSARWGGARVVRHAPDGRVDHEIIVPASQVTCPAFGGPDARSLYVTTAREGLSPEELKDEPDAGCVFKIAEDVPGRFEPEVAL
ncbi:MAG: SMP-30/gluconolactonase/LRE family protein [Pseudomonadota bacterium]